MNKTLFIIMIASIAFWLVSDIICTIKVRKQKKREKQREQDAEYQCKHAAPAFRTNREMQDEQ